MSERVCCGYPWMLVHRIFLRSALFLFTRTLTLLVIASSCKIEEFLHKMAISLKICRVEQKYHSFFAWYMVCPSVLSICSGSLLSSLFICSSLSLVLSSTAPFGRPSASRKNSLFYYACCISLRSSQDTISEGVVSKYWCSLIQTLTASIGIWYCASATKSWLLVLQLSGFCRIPLMCGELPLNSPRSFVSTLVLVVVDSSWFKIEEFLRKRAIGLTHWRVEQKNYSFLINWPAWAFCFQHLFRLNTGFSVHLCHCLSSSIAQFPWFHCPPWSAFGLPRIPSISRSASLSPCISAYCCQKHNSKRRSF